MTQPNKFGSPVVKSAYANSPGRVSNTLGPSQYAPQQAYQPPQYVKPGYGAMPGQQPFYPQSAAGAKQAAPFRKAGV